MLLRKVIWHALGTQTHARSDARPQRMSIYSWFQLFFSPQQLRETDKRYKDAFYVYTLYFRWQLQRPDWAERMCLLSFFFFLSTLSLKIFIRSFKKCNINLHIHKTTHCSVGENHFAEPNHKYLPNVCVTLIPGNKSGWLKRRWGLLKWFTGSWKKILRTFSPLFKVALRTSSQSHQETWEKSNIEPTGDKSVHYIFSVHWGEKWSEIQPHFSETERTRFWIQLWWGVQP